MTKLNKLAIYDESTAISIAGGSKTIAAELLELFVADLLAQTLTLEQNYLEADWPALRELIHKLNGSASYCATIALKEAIQELEIILIEDNIGAIDEAFEQVQHEIDRLLEFYGA